jgi:hypothetical protein
MMARPLLPHPLGPRARVPHVLSPVDDAEEDITETLDLTFPAVAFLTDEGVHRQGIAGSTALGDFVAIPWLAGGGEYFFATHDNGAGRFVGVDPGAFEAALAGFTGHEVQLASGQRTAAQVATAFEAVMAGVYASSIIASATVTIEDEIDAAAAFTGGSYDAAGGGAITNTVPRIGGIRGFTHSTQNASFTATTAASRLRASDLPAGLFRVIGFRIKWGTSHTGQQQVAVYQGGSGFDYQGATLLGRLGVTTGSATSAWVDVLCGPNECIEVDPANGSVWVCWMGDGATAPFAFFSSTGVGVGAAAHFEHDTAASNNAIWTLGGTPPTGSGGTFPGALPARGAASAFKPAIQLIIQEAPYKGDWLWKSRIGYLASSALAQSSAMTGVFTSNAYTSPNATGVAMDRVFVNYSAHDAGEQFRIEVWEGGTNDTTIAAATRVWDAGQTSGTATGWVGIVDAGSHPITPNTRMWISVKANTGNSSLAYGGGGAGYTAATTPAAFYRGNTTESEYVSPDAGFSHDPSVATPTPFAPVGSNINNNNSTGLYAIVKIPGFSMVANPP